MSILERRGERRGPIISRPAPDPVAVELYRAGLRDGSIRSWYKKPELNKGNLPNGNQERPLLSERDAELTENCVQRLKNEGSLSGK